MEKLKDVVLTEKDIVKYVDKSGQIHEIEIMYDKKASDFDYGKILKIERPTYETIYEAPKQILDQKEKEYLEAVIRPFKNRVKYIVMLMVVGCDNEFRIYIQLSDSCINLPNFKSGTMYKGMEYNKEYTLEELGLFGGE